MAEAWKNIPREREVCCKYPSEVWDDGLKIHRNSHGDISEEVERL
jgi:hypothetical protein